MTDFIELLLLASNVGIAALGGILVFVSLRTYHRNKSPSMLAMSLGFVLIAAGPLLEEFLLDILQVQLIDAHILMHFLVATGLLILVYSLYGTRG
jgi:hypothetical protein